MKWYDLNKLLVFCLKHHIYLWCLSVFAFSYTKPAIIPNTAYWPFTQHSSLSLLLLSRLPACLLHLIYLIDRGVRGVSGYERGDNFNHSSWAFFFFLFFFQGGPFGKLLWFLRKSQFSDCVDRHVPELELGSSAFKMSSFLSSSEH